MCEHKDFEARVEVERVLKGEGGPVERFMANVKVRCADCGVDFRFIGLPHGLDLNGACVGPDGVEGRFAVAPKGEVLTMVDGVTGYTARRAV